MINRMCLLIGIGVGFLATRVHPGEIEPTTPKTTIQLFNGRDLAGLTTWLKDTKHADPRRVFRVTDHLLHITGDGFGYIATDNEYS